MSELERRSTPPITPVYEQQAVDEPIALGDVPVEILAGDDTYPGTAKVHIDFGFDEKLLFDVTPSVDRSFKSMMMFSGQDAKLRLSDRSVTFPVIEVETNRFTPNRSVVTTTSPATNLRRCIFHLFNFPAFFSTTDYLLTHGPDGGGWTRCGQVFLRSGGWQIHIAANGRTDDDDKALKGKRGWKTSHMGEIVREDGSDFTSEQVQDVMLCLYYCLSFAMGRWVAIALPVGTDANGDRVFEEWGFPKASSGRWRGGGWFDDHNGDALAELFPGFWALWNRELWRKAISESIYWYMGASDRSVGIGVDTGLVLSQTALEHLAWTYCVQDRHMVDAKAFKDRGLSAANKFRLLTSTLGVPKEVPSHFKALNAKRGERWVDGLEAITAIRNATVHPDDKSTLPLYAEYEAWTLSLWYLDMIILRLCNYSGKYGSRLHPTRWAGQVEPVPWATATA